MKNKLRLLITEECKRNCEGCCNKDWDLKNLPVEKDFRSYDEILLTGGEPLLLDTTTVLKVIKEIKNQNQRAKIYLYTAKIDDVEKIASLLHFLDGITVTLHDQKDAHHFLRLYYFIEDYIDHKIFRLNVFKGITTYIEVLNGWRIKKDIEWIDNCPLPEGEIFKRYTFPIREKKQR